MKKQYIILALGAMLMASCAEEFDRNFKAERPEKLEQYAYLTDYKALKEYVSDPNFHLGVGTDAADYANQGVAYVVTNANFNETVAGNAMKMASCVSDDGSMDFGTVEAYVKEATKAGINVYGHTLAWHAQQPTLWLKTLISDKEEEVDPDKIEYEEIIEEQLVNPDCEGADATNYVCRDGDGSGDITRIEDGVGVDGSRGVRVHSIDNPTNEWDSQFFITTPDHVWKEGDEYEFSMKAKADKEASVNIQSHTTPGNYIHWSMLDGSYKITTEWQEFTFKGKVTADQAGGNGLSTIAFNLNVLKEANNYYFDDMSWKSHTKKPIGGGGATPQTPEELLDTLTYAMDLWIGGMMEACKNEEGTEVLVKAWDVVNEAVSGEDKDGDGIYDLQHGKVKISDLKKTDDFFWQDYMGDLEYVRTAVKKARQYGGTDLKLFVNDYNLESDWDQNKKLKSLIEWIKKWEADGVTKIDGIGSQMHISYYMKPETQESKKKAIENSFKLMAESGKLVRISELDMGLVDAEGNDINTADVTEEQHHAMAEFYTWIIKKYKEIIPAAQQWGICQWCATDSPAGSGWRANQPVGLWDQNYYRKHTYAGFADGLGGE
jgi:GH35 family endo-1,4-beta-xylanase